MEKNFGSLYLNGQPSELKRPSPHMDISLGDTVPGKAIHFVKWKDLWVASEIVCPSASWNDLEKNNYITGWPIRVDGVLYLCRSLKVGEESDVPNEWDSILDDLGEDDGLWHWSDGYFWGQETSRHLTSFRAVRGRHSARYWDSYEAAYWYVNVGFRPVLEPLPPAPLISDSLIGAGLKVCGPNAAIIGRLVEYTDYDLVMAPNAGLCLPRKCQWARRDGKRIIIDRAAIVWMKEE